jgi:anti-sigma regulatory factor (Ser/Thr protein kinase)
MMNASKDADRVLKLEFERNPEAPALARAAVIGFSEDRDFSPGTIATVTLLASEIVTNAVIHPQVEPPGRIGFYARLDEDRLRIEVSDSGSGFVPRPRDPSQPEGGYGLYLLEKEATSWGIEQAPHTTVWFEVLTTEGA